MISPEGAGRSSIALNGASPTVTDYTYNAANQLVSDGTNTLTYDNNGNLTSDGVNSYVWDRANRLLSMGGASYQYDGEGRRTQQTVSSIVTKYLLDTQPGLAVVLSQTEGSDIMRNIHTPRGIHAHKDAAGAWEWMVQDGLGSVRGVADHSAAVLWSGSPAPYGGYFDETGTRQTHYGFTGEPMDDNGLLYLRARYYNPAAGVFTALDPFEGKTCDPMSLNGYSYVAGNPINMVDPSGAIYIPGGLELAYLMNASACFSLISYQQPSTCALSDKVDVIASFARQEANQEDDQLLPTAAAIALAEINYLGFGNNVPRARSATYYASTRYVNAENSTKIRDFVSKYVEGACNGALVEAVNQQSSLFSQLTKYASELEYIAQNPTIAYEHSFISDNRAAGASSDDASGVRRTERLGRNTITNIVREQEAFMFKVFRGTTKSVVVSNDFSPVPLEWNCSVAENRVINSAYNPNSVAIPDFVANSSCAASCNRSVWWWRPPTIDIAKQYAKDFYSQFNSQYNDGDAWIRIPDSDATDRDYQSAIVRIGGTGHVAACS